MGQENTKLLNSFLENALDGIIIWDKDGRIIQSNFSAEEIFGYRNKETKGMQISGLVPELAAYHWDNWQGEPLYSELSGKNRLSKVLPLEVKVRYIEIDGESLVIGNFRDLTDEKQQFDYIGCCFDITTQKESETGNQLIKNIAMQVLEEKPDSEILQYLCNALVDMFDLSLAWVGFIEKGGSISIQSHSGSAVNYINSLNKEDILWDTGAAGMAAKSGKSQSFEVRDSGQHPWLAEAYKEGIRSVASQPLKIKGEVLGVIAFYSGKENFFNANRMDQLESIAGQIAILLNASIIRQRLYLFSMALEAADNTVMILDRKSKIIWVNHAFSRLSGYTKEEVTGRHPSLLSSGPTDSKYYRSIDETIYSGKVWKGELINKSKGGSIYTVEATITPVHNQLGSIVNFIEIHQDITERKQKEEKLEQYKILFERVQEIICLARPDGSFVEVNKATCKAYGYTMKEFASLRIGDFRPAGTCPTVPEQLQKADEKGITYETIHIKKDGSVFPVEITLQAVDISQEKFLVSIVRDLTERKREEAERLKALERVEKAERLASLGTMVAVIAHEINQPLNALRVIADGTLYLSQKGKITDYNMAIENLSKVSEEVNRIDEIIRHMRMLIGRENIQKLQSCSLNEAVLGALKVIGAHKAYGIKVITCLPETLPKCLGIPARFEEVVINLITNSFQALEMSHQEEKEIYCITLVEGDTVVLKISDNGPGIPWTLRDKVFEPFFTNKPVGVGMGLGLTIVHAIISSYQGLIKVCDNVPQGTSVIIKLPIKK